MERYSVNFYTLKDGKPVLFKTCTRQSLHTVVIMMDKYAYGVIEGTEVCGATVHDNGEFLQGKGEYESNN
jgi:hypothetical protein